MRIAFLGDVVGKSGCKALKRVLPRLIDKEQIDLVVVNGENAASGAGLDLASARELFEAGAHVVTSGNHIWRRAQGAELVAAEPHVLRPANFPKTTPGRGWVEVSLADGTPAVVLNLIGRVFMVPVDCPFQAAEEILGEIHKRTRVIVVDVHAEATSEKGALGYFLDGKVSAVFGSHTHVQTSDERVLPGGTAFITDAGMCGPAESVIGVRGDLVLKRFLTQMPVRFEVAPGPVLVQGAIVDVDADSGRATGIRRLREVVVL